MKFIKTKLYPNSPINPFNSFNFSIQNLSFSKQIIHFLLDWFLITSSITLSKLLKFVFSFNLHSKSNSDFETTFVNSENSFNILV